MSESEEEIFLTQSSFNGSINPGHDFEIEKLLSSKNLEDDYENAQFSIEEATEGLFSFNQADEYEEVSMGSVETEGTETNEKVVTKQAEPITSYEEEIMWETLGVLGDQDPKTLLHTLVFLFGKFFALRSGEEHRSLTFQRVSVMGHFTVVGLVTWPLSGSEAGGDLVLIQTHLLFKCK